MRALVLSLAASALALAACATPVRQETTAAGQGDLMIQIVAERRLQTLPPGPLYWRIETFATRTEADAAAEATSLTADAMGRAWLFTLGAADASSPGATRMAQIGPVPIVEAPEYLLRLNRATGPRGAVTPVHTHPGSEAFYVLSGQLSQRTQHGVMVLNAGESMNGHGAGMVMQLTSTGEAPLDQFVLFVVDATQPFSSPAAFE